jgi:hypothetical protein
MQISKWRARNFSSHVQQLVHHTCASKTELKKTWKLFNDPTISSKPKLKFGLITRRNNFELRTACWTHLKCRSLWWSLHLTSEASLNLRPAEVGQHTEAPFALALFSFVDTSRWTRSPQSSQRTGLSKIPDLRPRKWMCNGILDPFIFRHWDV